MNYKFWINISLYLLPYSSIWAQAQFFDQLSNVLPASPQAASLIKSVEYPVSYFNGQAEISIPLYGVKSGDISIPVNLTYSNSGIRVSEEPSWVGLGFALRAGGVITRDIKGTDDFVNTGTATYFNRLFPTPYGTQYNSQATNTLAVGCCYSAINNMYDKAGNLASDMFYNFSIGSMQQPIAYDGQPDLFMYNFGDYSGKFIHDGIDTYDMSRQNVAFSIYYIGTSLKPHIKAIAPDGFSYYFDITEDSYSTTSGSAASPVSFYLTTVTSPAGKKVTFEYTSLATLYAGGACPFTSCTSGIVYGAYALQTPSVSAHYQVKNGSPTTISLSQSVTNTYSTIQYLSKINFDNGYATFSVSPRADAYAYKLDNLTIYKPDNTPLKSYTFTYDYFVGSADYDEDFLNLNSQYNQYNGISTGYPEEYRKKRLKLLKISENGNPATIPKEHLFDYNNDVALPYKTSKAQDYWGYYNGAKGNNNMLPDFTKLINIPLAGVSNPFLNQPTPIANREADPAYVTAGLLKKITYPTGGCTTFGFESNQYTNTGILGTTRGLTGGNASATDVGPGTQTGAFYLPRYGTVNVDGYLFCNDNLTNCTVNNGVPAFNTQCGCLDIAQGCSLSAPENILFARIEKCDDAIGTNCQVYSRPAEGDPSSSFGNLEWSLSNIPCANNGHFTGNYNFEPGYYRVVANYPDNKTGSTANTKLATINANYSYTADITVPLNAFGGGTRVASVNHYDPVTAKTLSKIYQYSGGKMMRFPVFYWQNSIVEVAGTHGTSGGPDVYEDEVNIYDYLYANSVIPYAFSANGGLVGYEKVTEINNSTLAGSTIYEYETQPDILNLLVDVIGGVQTVQRKVQLYAPGVPSVPQFPNGFLSRVTHYDQNNVARKQVENIPLVLSKQTYWSFFYLQNYNGGQSPGSGPENRCMDPRCQWTTFYFYPIQVSKVVGQQSVEREYAPDGVTSLSATTLYDYNAQTYLKTQATTNSDGMSHIKQMAYPMDYSTVTGWVKDLWTKNMINMPLETLEMVSVAGGNASVTGGAFVVYTTHDGLTTPSQVYKVETANPDAAIQSTAPANLPPGNTAFVLNGTVQYNADGNLAFSQKANDLPVSYIWGYNKSLPVAKAINALPGDLFYEGFEEATANTATGGAKTGKKYFTGSSYTKNISGLTNGSYTVSYWRLNNGAWQPVNNTFSGTSYNLTITLNGGISGIDEVRIYPANARMTTYTYDPLIGMTSSTDENNITIYYEYDSNGRLANLRDYQNNIVKHYTYHYADN